MRLALAQLEIEGGDVAANRERALDAVAAAADRGADLVALPEIFNVGYFAFDAYQRAAEPVEGPTLRAVADAAREHDIGVLAGSIVEDLAATESVETPADEGLANTSVLFDRDGGRLAVYRKHHLFGYESAEARLLVPGERLGVADFGEATVGMTTCYDLRFPELYRSIAERGADLVLVPSAWPYPRVEHWKLLPRTRAVENQLFVAAVNGSGADGDAAEGTSASNQNSKSSGDATLLGRSTVYDPWGTALAGTGDEPDLVVTDVDLGRVDRVREEFPAWRDRRA